MDYLKVSSKSSPASVAGAIAGMVKNGTPVEIQSVGAGAVNQAIKAIAIARGFLVPSGLDVLCAPTFQDIQIDGERRTAIRLSVYPRVLTASTIAPEPQANVEIESCSTDSPALRLVTVTPQEDPNAL